VRGDIDIHLGVKQTGILHTKKVLRSAHKCCAGIAEQAAILSLCNTDWFF